MVIGIIGAGKLGITLAQLTRKAGYDVLIAGSGDPEKIRLSVEVLAPGAVAEHRSAVTTRSAIIILALPLSRITSLLASEYTDKLVVDATNYWWEVDGPKKLLFSSARSSSEFVQATLPGAHIVKAFNHMGYHDLHDNPRPVGDPHRRAIALAGDNASDKQHVAALIHALGFDSLDIGPLVNGWRLDSGTPAFGANTDTTNLKKLVSAAEAAE